MNIIEKAIQFATKAHEGACRKGTMIGYKEKCGEHCFWRSKSSAITTARLVEIYHFSTVNVGCVLV